MTPARDDRLHGLRVLYVEDDRDVAESARELLHCMGADVHLCMTFEHARSRIESSGGAGIDVLLTDLSLDHGHIGPELLMLLRRAPHGARVPAVLLTAFGGTDDRIASQAVGFQHHLVKPAGARLLADTLLRAVQAASSNDDAAGEGDGASGSETSIVVPAPGRDETVKVPPTAATR